MTNFKNIDYLMEGNAKQQKAYQALNKLGIFEKLKKFSPLLTGTIPIEIDLPESDLDIICECDNHDEFTDLIIKLFGQYKDFKIHSHDKYGLKSTVCKFWFNNFEIEIFGQNRASERQNAYRHMLIEHRILQEKGAAFRVEIIALKAMGLKTEPAFAELLKLEGNPYEALLKLE
ncbi:MAG: DUF4269 domain-containing protein [Bacteroidales bacterium]|nr:DUF4269 domain-containing protein [Bacteroidales bacterium]